MSSDLLKEFGSPEVIPWRADANQSAANRASVDEDEFGDFEDPSNNEDVTHAQSSLLPSDAVVHPVGSESNGVHSLSAELGYTHPSMTEVRDASSDDDDWGEFSQQSVMFDADVEVIRQKKEAGRILAEQHGLNQEHVDVLLHPIATTTEALTPTSPVSAATRANDCKPSPKATKNPLQFSKDASKNRVEATESTNYEQATTHDEPWLDFETVEATEAGGPGPKSPKAPYSHTLKAVDFSNLGPPPSNIPPPSILLPLVATTFASLPTELKTIQTRQPSDQPSSTTLSAIGNLLSALRAAARILAGRKLRWKRDTLLAQGMKIGPAHAGKAGGGMKLAGLDGAESRREDREAAEALQVWKQRAGASRSTVAALNGRLPEGKRFRMPDVADGLPVRQGKASEGAVTAARCCFLCGIKRDERVAKVDVEVEDSFGEWWVEHWGHVDCVAFWENHKDFLRQR